MSVVHRWSLIVCVVLNCIVQIQLQSCSYLIKMPLGQQDGTHRMGALVVRGSVFVRISIPPTRLYPLTSSVSVGAGSAHLVRSKSTRSSSTHFISTT